MSQKKTYVYHMLIGRNQKTEVDCFCYARNAKVATAYCKELYREKKYDSYKAIKVGICLDIKETKIVDKEDEMKMRNAGADRLGKFSEREIDLPQFVLKEEAGELL